MQLNAYLSFNGQCEEAFKFYEKCLGGTIQTMMTWGDSPMGDQVSPDLKGKIIHASLMVGDEALLGADSPPGRYESTRGVSVSIQLKDVAKAEQVFSALSDGATVTMPLQQTFWAARFGMLTDRYGVPWMVNCGESS